ncbi:hypothetical protein VaNZ11_001373 [Volvox africanus]|uniref:Uncharacterized protein n=1 Tax=Volvox africanus TaxID=51714 RepID=A0ABQ5RQJ7_9CHLO|nr:hypothetical protein VaNZ11_001373 [Volvox africanus]
MIPQQLLEDLVGGQNGANLDKCHQDKSPECLAEQDIASEVKELQQRVAKLEALLLAFINAFPTVMPKDALLSAAARFSACHPPSTWVRNGSSHSRRFSICLN